MEAGLIKYLKNNQRRNRFVADPVIPMNGSAI